MQLKGFFGAVALSASLFGCGDKDPGSNPSHDLDKPVRHSNAWQWIELDQTSQNEVFLPFVLGIQDRESGVFLSSDETLSKRMQAWLDRFDTSIRAEHGEELANTPKPKILVQVLSDPNASVMPVPVCLNVGVELGGATDVEAPAILVDADGDVRPAPASGKLCIEKNIDAAQFQDFVAWMNSEMVSCKLKIVGAVEDQKVALDDKCNVSFPLNLVASAKKLVYLATPNIVNIQLGLVPMLDEEPFAAVLSHELGHYYRAHNSAAQEGGKYNFFYTLDKENPNHVPTPDHSLNELGQRVRSANDPTDHYHRVENQKIRSELIFPVSLMASTVDSLQDCEEAKSCNVVCRDYVAYITDTANVVKLNRFPLAPLGEGGREVLTELESRTLACLQTVKIGEDEVATGRSISLSNLRDALSVDPNLAEIFGNFTAEGTVSDALALAEKALEKAVQDAKEPLVRAAAVNLGYYTAEQEADELAVEWLADVGVDPKAAIETELALGRMSSTFSLVFGSLPSPLEVHPTVCETLYKNDWIDHKGKYFFVPIVDFVDPHHSACYRAFNVSREIKAHGLVANPNAPSFVAGSESWADIKKTARDILDGKNIEVQEEAPLLVNGESRNRSASSLGYRVQNSGLLTSAQTFRPLDCAFWGN